MEAKTVQQNKMGVMPVWKLLINMTVPLAISVIVQSLYNIIDSLFLSRLGESVLTATSLAATMQTMMNSMAIGIGVGVTSVVAQHLGARRREKASLAAMNGLFVTFCGMMVFVLFGVFFMRQYFLWQTSDEEIIGYGIQYLQIVMFASVGLFGEVTLERLLSSTGKNTLTMITQFAGAVINIALDPLFIFTFGLGIRGAAIATVVGQIGAMLLAWFFNIRRNQEIAFSFKGFHLDGEIIGAILRVGLPTMALSAVGSIMGILINRLVTSYSSAAMAAYGIYNKLQHLVQSPTIALAAAIVPIVAYNYGARNRKRIVETVKWAMIYSTGVMIFAASWFMFFPDKILSVFNPSDAMMEAGVPIFRIIGFTFLLTTPSQVCSSYFQGIGNGMFSLITTLSRQVIVRLPLAYLFASMGGLSALWYCWPISEICSDIVACALALYLYHKKVKPLDLPLQAE